MDRSTLRALALVSGLGFAVALPLGLFFYIGLQLDDRFGTKPLFMLLGLVIGLIAAGATIAQLLSFTRGGDGRTRGGARRTSPRPGDEGTEED